MKQGAATLLCLLCALSPLLLPTGRAAMDEPASHQRVVYDFSQLKALLEDGNNGVTAVYLGADIEMGLTGVRINPKKSHVIIDGINPWDDTQTQPHTLTDYRSAAFTDVIRVDAAGVRSVTLRNLNITGRNYYGTVGILDAAALSDVVLSYENVHYNGPQLGYHRQGLIVFKDCDAWIHGGNGGSIKQEFSEAKHLRFSGTNAIRTDTQDYSVFWHPLGGSFTLENDAVLRLDSPNTSQTFGVFYADGYLNNLSITIGEGAVFEASAAYALAPTAFSSVTALNLQPGGHMRLKALTGFAADVLTVNGPLNLAPGASLHITGPGATGRCLLSQEKGGITMEEGAELHLTASGPYARLLRLRSSPLVCRNPASVLLYNGGRTMEAEDADALITVEAQQLNLWDNLSPGGLEHPPLRRWTGADEGVFRLEAALKTGANGQLSVQTAANLTPDTPPLTNETLNMNAARVLSWGRLTLTLAQPTPLSAYLTGSTAPGAAVRAYCIVDGTEYPLPEVVADNAGVFALPLDAPLPVGAAVRAEASRHYLYAEARTLTAPAGGLHLEVPARMAFHSTPLQEGGALVRRADNPWRINVYDSRGAGGWSLWLRLLTPLTPANPSRPILSDALVWVDEKETITPLRIGEPRLIHSRSPGDPEELTAVHWPATQGVLVLVPGSGVYAETYTALLEWTLTDAP